MNEPASVDSQQLRSLALSAGELIQSMQRSGEHEEVEHKGRIDLVTRVDKAVQDFLVDAIEREFPGDFIVAEEGDQQRRPDAGQAVWFVDPIDGTTNFVHGYPFYCVSIARWDERGPSLGVVYAPALDELFLAMEGAGATLERPMRATPPVALHTSSRSHLGESLLATGFSYERGRNARLNLSITAHALADCRGIRRGGSAALDLCYVAAGRLDGYWEFGLQPWDIAAGILIVREAGGIATDFVGDPDIIWSRRICASGADLHPRLIETIARAHDEPELDVLAAALSPPVPRTGPLPSEEHDHE